LGAGSIAELNGAILGDMRGIPNLRSAMTLIVAEDLPSDKGKRGP
jgi:hypothetical protein